MEVESALYLLYDHYCRFGGDGVGGAGMTSRNFAKFMRDRGAIDTKVTLTIVDLAFTKAAHGRKRINYEQFCFAIQLCAKAKDMPVSIFLQRLLSTDAADRAATGNLRDSRGVAYTGVTKPAPNRFYDDRSTWNALHKNGGPESVPKAHGLVPSHIAREPKRELPQPAGTGFADTTPSRRRASEHLQPAPRPAEGPRRSSAAAEYVPPASGSEARRASPAPPAPQYATPGRDTHDASAAHYRTAAAATAAPKYTGVTKPLPNRFYDDRSTWTHMHKNGGPDHGPKRGSMTAHWTGALRN